MSHTSDMHTKLLDLTDAACRLVDSKTAEDLVAGLAGLSNAVAEYRDCIKPPQGPFADVSGWQLHGWKRCRKCKESQPANEFPTVPRNATKKRRQEVAAKAWCNSCLVTRVKNGAL